MLECETGSLLGRVADLERQSLAQRDEIVCLRATLADALRRIAQLEGREKREDERNERRNERMVSSPLRNGHVSLRSEYTPRGSTSLCEFFLPFFSIILHAELCPRQHSCHMWEHSRWSPVNTTTTGNACLNTVYTGVDNYLLALRINCENFDRREIYRVYKNETSRLLCYDSAFLDC